jgi:hypothetical protein
MITENHPSVIERAIDVVVRSGADTELLELLSPPGRGRRPSYNTTAFLVGALLSVQWSGSVVIRDIHRILTQRLPLDYGDGSAPDLTAAERSRRREAILKLSHRLLATTLNGPTSTSRAIDGTGIWSYGRAPRAARTDLLARDAQGEPLDEPTTDVTDGDRSPPPSDPDAAHGVKTRKDGRRETYCGYELHALVRVPDDVDQFVAPLFESFEVTPAGRDIVDPSLGLLDRSTDSGFKITDLLADRHYSYKTEDRWYYELLRRGIRQHVDLHPNDQGFRDYNGMKLAAGWMHCPATPERLGRIDGLAPTADQAARTSYSALIDERQTYALRRVARQNATTGARWECPALDGRVGCPLRAGTVEVAHRNRLPVVANPPAPATAPKCCTQRTVTTGTDAQPKVEQQHYWGSQAWKTRYNARTYVEGAFGNLKNRTTESVARGFFQVSGLAKVNLMIGIALTAHNLRMLRSNADPSDPNADPLTRPDLETHGHMFVTAEEEQLLLSMRAATATS